MQSNTEKKNKGIFDYDEKEKFRVEEMFLNDGVVQVIKQLMKLNNIKTKKELAQKTGVSAAYISKVFRSDKNFNVAFLVKMERVFNTTFTFNAASLEKTVVDSGTVSATPNKAFFDSIDNYAFMEEEIAAHIQEQEPQQKECIVINMLEKQTLKNNEYSYAQ